MTVTVRPDRLRDAAHSLRSSVATSDLCHHFTAYRVGEIDSWRSLHAFTTAASAFAGNLSEQLVAVSNALNLGANHAAAADDGDGHELIAVDWSVTR